MNPTSFSSFSLNLVDILTVNLLNPNRPNLELLHTVMVAYPYMCVYVLCLIVREQECIFQMKCLKSGHSCDDI